MKGYDVQTRDILAGKAVALLQVQHRCNRSLCPSADWIRLEILLADEPAI
jgi:hypothetical protein